MRDYWSFPAVMRSFRATGYGRFETHEGLEWRVRGRDYVLVEPPKRAFKIPDGANPERVRSLSFIEGAVVGVPVKRVGWCWGVDDLQNFAPNRKTRYALRLAERDEAILTYPLEPDELRSVFENWVNWMQERKPSTMLVKGHYQAMIDDPGFVFFGCRVNDKLIGASGFTWEGATGAVCFTKHESGYWWLSRWLWWQTLDRLKDMGVKEVNCGDTADTLKKELGFTRYPQYKVDFSKIPCTTPIET